MGCAGIGNGDAHLANVGESAGALDVPGFLPTAVFALRLDTTTARVRAALDFFAQIPHSFRARGGILRETVEEPRAY